MSTTSTSPIQRNPDESSYAEDMLIRKAFSDRSPTYVNLLELRKQGWQSPKARQEFENRRDQPFNAQKYYSLHRNLARQLWNDSGCLSRGHSLEKYIVLDLGMAPGGFAAYTKAEKLHSEDDIYAVTLPDSLVSVHADVIAHIEYADLTKLTTELNRPGSPAEENGVSPVIFPSMVGYDQSPKANLVLCDSYSSDHGIPDRSRTWRLNCAQLLFGLRRLKHNGTLIIRLKRLDVYENVEILVSLRKISNVNIFKPTYSKNFTRSAAFYLIANQVQTRSLAAMQVVDRLRTLWNRLSSETASRSWDHDEHVSHVMRLLKERSPDGTFLIDELTRIAEPGWSLERSAMEAWLKYLETPKRIKFEDTEKGKGPWRRNEA